MSDETHESVPPEQKKSFRKDMREFYKKQAEREKKEAIGFDGAPRSANPAMGIPFNPGGARPKPTTPKTSQPQQNAGDFVDDAPPVEENLLTGENIKDPEDDEEERESF